MAGAWSLLYMAAGVARMRGILCTIGYRLMTRYGWHIVFPPRDPYSDTGPVSIYCLISMEPLTPRHGLIMLLLNYRREQ